MYQGWAHHATTRRRDGYLEVQEEVALVEVLEEGIWREEDPEVGLEEGQEVSLMVVLEIKVMVEAL